MSATEWLSIVWQASLLILAGVGCAVIVLVVLALLAGIGYAILYTLTGAVLTLREWVKR